MALIPGLVIGDAAVLAPKYLPRLRRRMQPLFNSTVRGQIEPAVPLPDRPEVKVPPAAAAGFAIKQASAEWAGAGSSMSSDGALAQIPDDGRQDRQGARNNRPVDAATASRMRSGGRPCLRG